MVDRLKDTRGQALIEFALVLPLIVTLLIAVVEFGVVFKDWLSVTDTARVAARAAVVSRFGNPAQTPCAAAQAAVAAAGLTLASCTQSAGSVKVTVTHPWSVSLPLLPLSDGGQLTSVVTERLE
jgi:Flp pilus assembly protein TadG